MKNTFAIAALAVGSANALVARDNTCCFHLTASGGASGSVGQLDDGQNRVGGGLPAAQYCIDSSGGITDSNGRGCILTPPTTQFQCDVGAQPTTGFSINAQGDVEYNGSTQFVACQTGDNGELNIYTNPPPADVTGCVQITLMADNCQSPPPETSPAACPAPPPQTSAPPPPPETSAPPPPPETSAPPPPPETSAPPPPQTSAPPPPPETSSSAPPPPPPPTTTSATPTASPTSTSCPTNLSGNYEYPHLIVPIDSSSPDKAMGTSYNGEVSSTVSSIFNFDIPPSDSGKTCSLVFLFPTQSQLETSSFTFSGDGKVDIAELSSPATTSTTFNNAPSVQQDFGDFTIAPGNSYLVATFPCPAGQRVGFEIKNAGSTDLHYFQDYNPSPIGLYITTC